MTRPQGPLGAKVFCTATLAILLPLIAAHCALAKANSPALEVLRKAATFIEAQKAFKLDVRVEIRLEIQGQKQEATTNYAIAVARPDRLRVQDGSGKSGISLLVNDKQFVASIAALKQYAVSEPPAALSDVFESRAANYLGFGPGTQLFQSLLSEHAFNAFTGDVTDSSDLGVEKIEGHACRHLHFDQEAFVWDAWVDAGDQPLIRKILLELKKLPAGSGGRLEGAKLSIAYGLNDWDLKPKFADDAFAFVPAEGWEKADDLLGEEEEPHPLLSTPAPDFQLAKVGGGQVKLAKHLGKDVVILDFWATWCGPCVEALPKIAKVAKKYRDRGVVFYAVNLGDSAEDVEKFLKEQKLDVPVVLDTDNAVGERYQVDGIPQSVIIGKDGSVQVVHVGVGPDLEKSLSKELDGLLAGKNLAAETLDAYKKKQEKKLEAATSESKPDDPKPAAKPAK